MKFFVETSVAQRVSRTIDLARRMETNAAIIGVPGVGKTVALNAYKETHPLTAMFTITPILAGSLRSLLEEMCLQVGLYSGGSISDLEHRLIKFNVPLWSGHDSEMPPSSPYIVILDEAQNLPLKSLRQLLHMSVEDGGNISFVFCGNNEVLKRVNTDHGAFAQISRRVTFREPIESILEDDADLLASAFGTEGMDAYRLLRAIGAKFHADGVVRVLKMARQLGAEKVIRASHVLDAINVLPQFRPAIRNYL